MKRSEVSKTRFTLVAAALTVGAIGACAPAAGAAEPGVIFEPGSPSYKEYAIPLEQARRDAGGAKNGVDSSAFGIGLSKRATKGGASRGRGPGKGGGNRTGAGADGGGRTAAQPKGSDTADSSGLEKRLAEAESADAPLVWRLGVPLLVLLPALLVGLLLFVRRDRGLPPAAP